MRDLIVMPNENYKPRPQKVDPKTGRSIGTLKFGQSKNWKPEAPFVALSYSFITSPAYRELSSPARKILDFLLIEHMQHGGQENGNLAAPYRQLENFGISSRDIPKGLLMLETFGLVKRTNDSFIISGRNNMAVYKLTMIPDKWGNLPKDEWKQITLSDVLAFKANPKRHPK